MTRKSSALPTPGKRPSPPADLPPEAAKLWVCICAGLPSGHFAEADLMLLAALVTADHQKRTCDALVARDGVILPDGTANPALKLSITLSASMAALSAKLRLCKSSTTRAESAGLKRALAGSGFEDNDLSEYFNDRPVQ